MPAERSHTFKLQCHPESPCAAVRSLIVRLELSSDRSLRLRYALDAHVSRLTIPPPALPSRADGLWRHTCFEVFVATDHSSIYYELNFSPSSQWALYRFDSYRKGMTAPLARAPAISVRSSDYRLELDASAVFAELESLDRGALKVALTAVIESQDGQLAYWALRHPSGAADFHHADGFVML